MSAIVTTKRAPPLGRNTTVHGVGSIAAPAQSPRSPRLQVHPQTRDSVYPTLPIPWQKS
jgi:hypothetical protein